MTGQNLMPLVDLVLAMSMIMWGFVHNGLWVVNIHLLSSRPQ